MNKIIMTLVMLGLFFGGLLIGMEINKDIRQDYIDETNIMSDEDLIEQTVNPDYRPSVGGFTTIDGRSILVTPEGKEVGSADPTIRNRGGE